MIMVNEGTNHPEGIMKTILLTISILLGMMLIVSGCTQSPSGQPVSVTTPAVTTTSSALANPAAVFCENKTYQYRDPEGHRRKRVRGMHLP